jgi:hypothetical protein
MCDVAPARVLEIGRIGTRTDSPEAPDGRTSFGSAPTTVSDATLSLPRFGEGPESGASSPLPSVVAKVGLLNR